MCPEQCIPPFLVRQHISQKLALPARAAGLCPFCAALGVTSAYTATLGLG